MTSGGRRDMVDDVEDGSEEGCGDDDGDEG
jgi:hypothetical protein